MNAQEQQASKVLVGTAVFVIAFAILHALAVPSLAVAYAQPQLSAGSFDLWTVVASLLAPAIAAYVSVSSKLGGVVISMVSRLLARSQPIETASSTGLTVEEADKRYARLNATTKVVAGIDKRLQSVEQTVSAWSDQEHSQ